MVEPLVAMEIERLGGPIKAAERLNVSRSYLYMVLRGEREPSRKLLERLGLERVMFIRAAK